MSHTPGPWELSKTGLVMNDGSVPIMAPDPALEQKRVALVDIQTKAKRGEAYRTPCAERDANARLIAAAPDILEALLSIRKIAAYKTSDPTCASCLRRIGEIAQAAIAKAEG